MRRIYAVYTCFGLSLLGAAAACSSDPDGPGPGNSSNDAGSDAPLGSDARVNGDAATDGPSAIDAGVDAPSAIDAAADARANDAAVDAPGDGAADGGATDASDGGLNTIDAAADASPSSDAAADVDGSAADGSVTDAAPLGPVVTSPSTLARRQGAPPQGSCTLATLGTFGIFDKVVSTNGQSVTVPDATFCDADVSFGKTSYEWTGFDDVTKLADWVGTPINASWAGFVSFHNNGDYVGTLSIGLYESASSFVPVCRYKHAMVQGHAQTRGAAAAPEVDVCGGMAFSAYGAPKVRFIGGAPTGAFYPKSGGAPVPITFIPL
jgi:hypothetical protein